MWCTAWWYTKERKQWSAVCRRWWNVNTCLATQCVKASNGNCQYGIWGIVFWHSIWARDDLERNYYWTNNVRKNVCLGRQDCRTVSTMWTFVVCCDVIAEKTGIWIACEGEITVAWLRFVAHLILSRPCLLMIWCLPLLTRENLKYTCESIPIVYLLYPVKGWNVCYTTIQLTLLLHSWMCNTITKSKASST